MDLDESNYPANSYNQLQLATYHSHPFYPFPEVKLKDVGPDGSGWSGINTLNGTSAGLVRVLNTIDTGTQLNARTGLSVSIKSVSYNYTIFMTSPTFVYKYCRVMLLWDHQINGAIPTVLSILTPVSYLSQITPGASQRFTVLKDELHVLNSGNDLAIASRGFVQIDMKSTWDNVNVFNYPISGGLILLYICDSAGPAVTGCWRIRYTDN